jgi:Zn-finger nucleic acid-binding protein
MTAPLPRPRRILTCPICDQDMVAENRENVTVDVCAAHGIWFDGDELEMLMLKLRGRLGRRHRRRLAAARRGGRIAGSHWGWWSLLGE